MNIFITGGCGFIGSHLVDYYMEQGHNVLVLDNLYTGTKENVSIHRSNPKFKLEIADMLTWDGLQEAAKWSDCIYHMAAIVGIEKVLNEPLATIDMNLNSNQRLFKILANITHRPRVFIASSSMVYGESTSATLKETDTLHIKSTFEGHWTYAISKIVAETMASAYFNRCKIPVTILRIFNTIGPRQSGQYGMVMPRFIQEACSGKDITVYGDGMQTRSFCDVRDLVNALGLLALNDRSISEIVNVGNINLISINELAKMIKQRAHSDSNIIYVPYNEAYHHDFTDVKSRCPDLTKLLSLIEFQPQWTLEQSIDDLIARFNDKK